MGLVGGLCFAALGLMLFAYIFVSKSWVIVRHGSTMLVERFGQFHKQCKPGMHFLIPFVDHPRKVHWRYVDVRRAGNSHETYVVRKTTSVIDLREHVLDFGQQLVITKDTVNIVIDALLYYQIQDARLAALKIRNLPDALELLTQATLR
ncbi:stomatin family protein [Kipferlia bialata]|uniref:Stomatin family protein n=1 Tax=Kipferlia bialata TaxID=797122 RepID=A0A9K3CVY3_9EUKA|nr:stomatin family protein [Kipferlia bialata]|eukprot:g3741.t1